MLTGGGDPRAATTGATLISGWKSTAKRLLAAFSGLMIVVATLVAGAAPAAAAAAGSPFGYLDRAIPSPAGVIIAGWSIDPDTSSPVEVHLYRNNVFLGGYRADGNRPDVGAAYPAAGANHGYSEVFPTAEGRHSFCAYAINAGRGDPYSLLSCVSLDVTDAAVGVLDGAYRVPGTSAMEVSGWALDTNSAEAVDIHVYVEDTFAGATRADRYRSDIAARFPWSGGTSGFGFTVELAPGPHRVCAYALGVGPGAPWSSLGCTTVKMTAAPIGVLETARVGDSSLRVTGWALDPDVLHPVDIHFWIDGYFAGSVLANEDRTDVAQAFPGFGAGHGFGATLWLWPTAQNVCAYAINQAAGPDYVGLGCQAIAPAPPPNSGVGRRIVYANLSQRLWLIEADGFAARSYSVSGKYLDPPPGTYQVYAFQRYADAGHDDITMEYFVAFNPSGLGYGFHTIPVFADGSPLQSENELGFFRSAGCVRQRRGDAIYLWDWAQAGDPVVLLAA